MEEKKLVPRRRFKWFENIKSLQVDYLGELTDIRTGPFGSSLHAKDYVEDGIPIITTEHFKEGYLPRDKRGVPQVSYEDYLRLNAYKLQSGDIVFSRVGSVDINALTTNGQDGWLFSGRVLRVRPQEQLSSVYLHYLLETKTVKQGVVARAVGQTMPSINTEILNKTRIIITNNSKEQQKIGEFFKVLDERIANQERKIAKVKALKFAYLTEMFPQEGETVPKRRFKGFKGEWKKKRLNQLGEVLTGSTPPTNIVKYYSDKGVPWVTPTDINKNVTLVTAKHLSEEGQKVARIVPKNTILVTSIASIGKNTILGTTGSFNQQINGLIPIHNENDPYFLFVASTLWSKELENKAASGTMQIVNKTEFSNLITLIPNFKEQQNIGQFFKNLDDQITTEEKKLEKLKKMKEAYLEEMFV